MARVSDRDLELLADAFGAAEGAKDFNISRLVGEGETPEFYRGLINGLVIAHSLLHVSDSPERRMEVISLAAGCAAAMLRELQRGGDPEFPEIIGIP